MADWECKALDGLPLYQVPYLTSLPGVIQGFTTRQGGVSQPPYASLNLGSHVADNLDNVQVNRQRLWSTLGFAKKDVALAEQVHGQKIARVSKGGPPVPGVDALITDTPNLLLMLFFADCVPVYLLDPATQSIGLVHAGWRGTLGGIVPRTVSAMQEQFGIQSDSCRAAIGPCIGGESYEVGADIAFQFREVISVTSSDRLAPQCEKSGAYTLDLRRIIVNQLLNTGFTEKNIAVCGEDTFQNEQDFFSYRRDGKRTGRMAAFLAIKQANYREESRKIVFPATPGVD